MTEKTKFRAWDKELSKMVYRDGSLFDIPSRLPGNWRDFFIPLQYTGLKDKNDKEIYDGDILDVKAGESGVFRYQVVWNEKQCGWRNQYGQKLPQLFGKPNSEVIGNIYENSELFEAKNVRKD